MGYSCRDWEAWYDRMPGPNEGPALNISGECDCDEDGWKFELDVGNQGTPPDPELLRMNFKPEEPPFRTPVVTVEQVKFRRDVGDTYKKVAIQGGNVDVIVDIRDVGEVS